MAYCFDTSSLIECWSRSYPPDVFPGLWQDLDVLIELGHVRSAEEVRVELRRQDDDLAKWVNDRPALFLPLDEDIQVETLRVLSEHPLLMKATKNRNGADPFVIATALANGFTVVTEEQGGTASKPRIPSVCRAMGVRCIDVLAFIREQGWSFARS